MSRDLTLTYKPLRAALHDTGVVTPDPQPMPWVIDPTLPFYIPGSATRALLFLKGKKNPMPRALPITAEEFIPKESWHALQERT